MPTTGATRLLSVLAAQPLECSPLAALHAAMRALALDYRDDRAALGRARSEIVAASPQLQAYKAEHQHGWETAVVDELLRRPGPSTPRRPPRSCACSPPWPPPRSASSLDTWIADEQGVGPEVLLDRAFERIASGFGPTAT